MVTHVTVNQSMRVSKCRSASAVLVIDAYEPNAAVAVMKPQRPQRCSRAAANTIAVPIIVTQIEVNQPWCGGDAIVTSNP